MRATYAGTVALLLGGLWLGGCQGVGDGPSSAGTAGQAEQATQLNFVDFTGFDRDLSRALRRGEPVVTVVLYDKVSPNTTPDRLQKWLNAVENNGGKVEIEPPPNELVPRNPMALISLVGSLWTVVKAAADLRDKELTQSVRGHDAVIGLERNAAGQVVINKIVFKKAKSAS